MGSTGFKAGDPDPATGESWMPEPQQDRAGFNALPVGGGRIIQDNPDRPRTLFDPGTANVGKPMAMNIPAQYGGGVGRSTYGAPGATPGKASPISLDNDIQKQIVKQYPNVGIAGHADNQAFLKAYQQAYDPSKPMSADDVMKLAHNLFAPPSVPGSPLRSSVADASRAADQAQNFGANLVSHAMPSIVPDSPMMPRAPGPKMPVDPTSPFGPAQRANIFGTNYGVLPASDNPANKPGGYAYTGPGAYTPTPGPDFVRNPHSGKMQPDPSWMPPSTSGGNSSTAGTPASAAPTPQSNAPAGIQRQPVSPPNPLMGAMPPGA
jgi:hypothetical protein